MTNKTVESNPLIRLLAGRHADAVATVDVIERLARWYRAREHPVLERQVTVHLRDRRSPVIVVLRLETGYYYFAHLDVESARPDNPDLREVTAHSGVEADAAAVERVLDELLDTPASAGDASERAMAFLAGPHGDRVARIEIGESVDASERINREARVHLREADTALLLRLTPAGWKLVVYVGSTLAHEAELWSAPEHVTPLTAYAAVVQRALEVAPTVLEPGNDT